MWKDKIANPLKIDRQTEFKNKTTLKLFNCRNFLKLFRVISLASVKLFNISETDKYSVEIIKFLRCVNLCVWRFPLDFLQTTNICLVGNVLFMLISG